MVKIAEQFEDLKLNKQLLQAVEAQGYKKPTPIQQKAIPLIAAGHDVLGIAQTGTGKTAAYLIPLLMKVAYAQGVEPRALILAPTKELAIQINDNIGSLAQNLDIRHTVVYGGIGPKAQMKTVLAGIDILVATPGRFIDLYGRGAIPTRFIKTLVLDEADRILDMGFLPQIHSILEKIPQKRQNLLFSATFPDKVQALADDFLKFPERVLISAPATPAETVDHYYYPTPNLSAKIAMLEYLLAQPEYKRVIVFVKKKDTANNVYKFVDRKITHDVRVIHANKAQNSRINALHDFRDGRIRVLVTTDVSSRGIDVLEVSHVINFDVPVVYEDYVHRIGRTGRALLAGEAISFANRAEVMHISKIEEVIQARIPEMPLPEGLVYKKTSREEMLEIEREIDRIKRRDIPGFQGAFHQKKKKSIRGKRK
jgi:ATP-dependent RNA helicase RhlE